MVPPVIQRQVKERQTSGLQVHVGQGVTERGLGVSEGIINQWVSYIIIVILLTAFPPTPARTI